MNLLSDIITYVRRIIKTDSNQSLKDITIVDYLNRFYTYDVPARLQLFELKTKYNLLTSPNVDRYNMPYDANGNLQFQNLMPPCLCDGVMMPLLLDRNSFLKIYPTYDFNEVDAYGDGIATNYTFTTNSTSIIRAITDILGNTDPGVYITTLDADNIQMVVTDSGQFSPSNNNVGLLTSDGGATVTAGTINYLTGQVSVTFPAIVPLNNPIQIKYIPYAAGTPRCCLFFDNIISLRPVPNIAYLIEFDAYLTPAAFLSTNPSAALKFGYISEYLARGTARKILSDVGDIEQFTFYEPFFREQEALVIRRTNRQDSINRTPTIFTELNSQSPGQYQNGQGF